MKEIAVLCIGQKASVRSALETLEKTAQGILLLLDEDGKFLRTITDGDLRRLVLHGATLESLLTELPDRSSIVVDKSVPGSEVHALMIEHSIRAVPCINENGEPVDLFDRSDFENPILLSIPHMSDAETKYVNDAFATNWVAPLGPNVDGFEQEIARLTDTGHAAALSSGTAAIHLALVVLGVGKGDIVFCSSLTFVASANPIRYQGAEPVFIDSEPGSWNMCPRALEYALAQAAQAQRLPRAIVVVNLYGYSAEYVQLSEIAARYEVPIVEDAAESLGSTYNGRASGSFGDIGIFSFNGNKIITTSGGGMMVSQNEDYVAKARWLSTQAKDNVPYYQHSVVGYNYRMSNVLAGIGRGQLEVLAQRVDRRREIYFTYMSALEELGCFEWIAESDDSRANHWLSAALISKTAPFGPRELIGHLAGHGIEARRVWNPLHRNPLFQSCNYFTTSEISVSDDLFDRGVCLPSSSSLSDEQLDRVIAQIRLFVRSFGQARAS